VRLQFALMVVSLGQKPTVTFRHKKIIRFVFLRASTVAVEEKEVFTSYKESHF
jgi:hypothetical protein